MINRIDDIILFIIMIIIGLLILWLAIGVGYSLRADAICLDKGYPRSQITWNFNTYCSTLDGAITVKVQKQ